MERRDPKLVATAIIWIAFTVVSMGLIFSNQEFNFLLAAVLIGGAALGTFAIWERDDDKTEKEEAEKAKRRSRVERMLETLDERDLAELRARLTSESDGEAVSLDELLNEMETRRRG